jgi:hypothetical protein
MEPGNQIRNCIARIIVPNLCKQPWLITVAGVSQMVLAQICLFNNRQEKPDFLFVGRTK